MSEARHDFHLGIAEAGKLAAVAGDHKEALRHYREALRLAQAAKAPEVFFRHYTQCVLESLELTGAFGEILEFCENADAHYTQLDSKADLHARDHGAILERQGIVAVKAGDSDTGREALTRAVERSGRGTLPIAETVLGWLARGMSVDARRLLELQKKHKYFTVREDQVDAARANPLPKDSGKSVRVSPAL
ncbi:MAG: peptidylprolyl isomerase [Pseudomonadota bacterium]